MTTSRAEKAVVTVLVECVACGQQRDIKENEIGPDDYPGCNRCGSPVVAVKVKRKAARKARK